MEAKSVSLADQQVSDFVWMFKIMCVGFHLVALTILAGKNKNQNITCRPRE